MLGASAENRSTVRGLGQKFEPEKSTIEQFKKGTLVTRCLGYTWDDKLSSCVGIIVYHTYLYKIPNKPLKMFFFVAQLMDLGLDCTPCFSRDFSVSFLSLQK